MHFIVKKSLVKIDELKQFYVVAVKGNTPRLFAEFKQLNVNQALSVFKRTEKRKNRQVEIQVNVYHCTDWVKHNWLSSQRMIVVQNRWLQDGSIHCEQRFYLSNMPNDSAEYFANGIRQHWSIENKLHWVKDVQLNEDKSLIRHQNAVACYSVLMNWVLNIARFNCYYKWKDWLARFANRIDRIVAII